MSRLLRLCIVIALYALLLPAIGPVLDHHYVEWQHNHGHVYFGGGPEDGLGYHPHAYDSGDIHSHATPTDLAGNQTLPEGVAYLSTFDGSGAGPIFSPTGPSTESLCFAGPGDVPLLASYDVSVTPPLGALIAPPRKPPPA